MVIWKAAEASIEQISNALEHGLVGGTAKPRLQQLV